MVSQKINALSLTILSLLHDIPPTSVSGHNTSLNSPVPLIVLL